MWRMVSVDALAHRANAMVPDSADPDRNLKESRRDNPLLLREELPRLTTLSFRNGSVTVRGSQH